MAKSGFGMQMGIRRIVAALLLPLLAACVGEMADGGSPGPYFKDSLVLDTRSLIPFEFIRDEDVIDIVYSDSLSALIHSLPPPPVRKDSMRVQDEPGAFRWEKFLYAPVAGPVGEWEATVEFEHSLYRECGPDSVDYWTFQFRRRGLTTYCRERIWDALPGKMKVELDYLQDQGFLLSRFEPFKPGILKIYYR